MKVALLSWGMDDYWGSISLGLDDHVDLHVITSKLHKQKGYSEDFDFVRKNIEGNIHYVGHKNKIKSLFSPFRLIKIIKDINPDIIHFPGSKPNAIPLLYPILNKIGKLIVTIHDPCNYYGERSLQKIIRLKMGYNSSDGLIVPNETVKKFIALEKGKSISEKIHIVSHPAYETRLSNTEKEKKENSLLFFGNIRQVKGLDILIKSEPLIRQKIEDFKIIIAGSGDFQKYENLIENIENFEIYNRYLSNKEAEKLFQRARAIVLPYRSHPFRGQSGVVSTAFAFNLPIITTKSPHARIIEDEKTGLIVPPENPEELARAIVKFLKNKEIEKKIKRNMKKKVKEELSPSMIAEKTVKVYQRVLKSQ